MAKNAPHALCSSAPSNQTLPPKHLPLKNPRIKNSDPKVHQIVIENASSLAKSNKIPAFKAFAPEIPIQATGFLPWYEFFLPMSSPISMLGLKSVSSQPCCRGRVLHRGSLQWGQRFGWGARPPPWPLRRCTAVFPNLHGDGTNCPEQAWSVKTYRRIAFASGRDGRGKSFFSCHLLSLLYIYKSKGAGFPVIHLTAPSSPLSYYLSQNLSANLFSVSFWLMTSTFKNKRIKPMGDDSFVPLLNTLRKGQTQVLMGETTSMEEIANADFAGGSKMVCNIYGIPLASFFSSLNCLCSVYVELSFESAGQSKVCSTMDYANFYKYKALYKKSRKGNNKSRKGKISRKGKYSRKGNDTSVDNSEAEAAMSPNDVGYNMASDHCLALVWWLDPKPCSNSNMVKFFFIWRMDYSVAVRVFLGYLYTRLSGINYLLLVYIPVDAYLGFLLISLLKFFICMPGLDGIRTEYDVEQMIDSPVNLLVKITIRILSRFTKSCFNELSFSSSVAPHVIFFKGYESEQLGVNDPVTPAPGNC